MTPCKGAHVCGGGPSATVRFRFGRWLLCRMGMSQTGWRAEPRIYRHPGPVAEQTCCGAVPLYCGFSRGRLHSHLVFIRSPPCVCGRDVLEVTHGLAAAANRGCISP